MEHGLRRLARVVADRPLVAEPRRRVIREARDEQRLAAEHPGARTEREPVGELAWPGLELVRRYGQVGIEGFEPILRARGRLRRRRRDGGIRGRRSVLSVR